MEAYNRLIIRRHRTNIREIQRKNSQRTHGLARSQWQKDRSVDLLHGRIKTKGRQSIRRGSLPNQ